MKKNEIIKYSNAKINLSLDVLYKREDSYHEIESVMQEISLSDRLIFRNQASGITIESNNPDLPLDIHNLVYKVWKKMKEYTGISRGLYIYIDKKIPIGAGLAGGSSNAAATFQAINELWELDLSDQELMDLGKDIGADIPFCILGGTALAGGIGEELRELRSLKGLNILICNPGFEICTQEAYGLIDLNDENIDIEELVEGIGSRNIEKISKNLANKMEVAILKNYPVIEEIKDRMLDNGALGSLMSGSGPTVFGIFEDLKQMKVAEEKLLERFPLTIPSTTV